jgi:hypothetical protein
MARVLLLKSLERPKQQKIAPTSWIGAKALGKPKRAETLQGLKTVLPKAYTGLTAGRA